MLKRFLPVTLLLLLPTISYSGVAAPSSPSRATVAQSQQNGTVSGQVTDGNEPVIGATVLIESTGNGAITDAEGRFTISGVKIGESIEVSSLGYLTQTIQYGGESTLNITLPVAAHELEEVVVIGYGKLARKDITSSITTIGADDMNVGVYADPISALQGRVPGLTITNSSDPNSNPSIVLRGASTLRSGEAMEPYYVIDGIPGASITNVSPSDIETIDVLRDASATAIYGSKAANGVIIVNTKRGKAGQTSVSYNGYAAVDHISKSWDMMDASQYRSFADAIGVGVLANDDDNANTNWQDEVTRVGISQNHNLSLSGGFNNTTYNASVNYFDNQGVINTTSKERISARTFLETKAINDKLTVSLNLNANKTTQNNVYNGTDGVYDEMFTYIPITSIFDEDGNYSENLSDRSSSFNPLALIEENTYQTVTKNIMGNVKLNYEIIPGLDFTVSGSLENEQVLYNQYNNTNSALAIGLDGQAVRSSYENEDKVLESYINYSKTFGSRHKLSAMAGYSWEESTTGDGFQTTAYSFDGDDLTYNNLGAASSVDMDGFGSTYLSTLRMISFYGRINYSLDDKYLFQASIRRDGSSAFGVNNRWATFPSASAAWRISEEDFMQKSDLFHDLKLRVGYGVSGNSLGFDVFTATQRYGVTGWYENTSGDIVHSLGAISNSNPDLKWERTAMFNVGVDYAFLNGRLGGTIEYYNKETKDLINTVSVSTTEYIYSSLITNVGSVNNQGFEFTVYATPIVNRNFRWYTSLNISRNKNRVTELSNDEFTVDYMDKASLGGAGQSGAYQQRIMEGQPLGTFYTWEWAGYNDEGVSVFYVHDPETGERTGETTASPTNTDRTITGSAQPKVTLGWSNSFSYKKLSLDLQFQGTFGNDIMNASRAHLSNVWNIQNQNLLASVIDTELTTDKNAHYLSDRYIENGSYLRLQSLNLGYNFGRVAKNIQSLNVYFTCNNVFTITGYSGLNPEVNLGGVEPGIDNRTIYPTTRTFMIGANITF